MARRRVPERHQLGALPTARTAHYPMHSWSKGQCCGATEADLSRMKNLMASVLVLALVHQINRSTYLYVPQHTLNTNVVSCIHIVSGTA